MFLDKCSETNDAFRYSRSRMGLGYVVFAAEAQPVSPGAKARDLPLDVSAGLETQVNMTGVVID
jgi:hypothetical protein